jgi:hypothetical protein
MGAMGDQLTLVEAPREWKLDRRTREIGRKGVAEAREVLRRAGATPTPDAGATHRRAA